MIINVKVKPNVKEEKLERVSENKYLVSLKEPAENGKANKRLINLLAKELNVSYKQIKIKNPTARNKIIEIFNSK